MSGSPKWSYAELDERRQRELEAERRRQAAEEERRRKQREAERRRRQVRELQQDVDQAAARLQAEIDEPLRASYAAFDSGAFARLRAELDRLAQDSGEASGLGVLRGIQRAAGQLEDNVREAAAKAQAAELSERLRKERERQRAEAEAALSRIEARLAGQPEVQRRRFDPRGHDEMAALLARAREAIAGARLDQAREALRNVEPAVHAHLSAVAREREAWEEARAEALTSADEAEARCEALSGDEVVAAWCAAELSRVREGLDRGRARLQREDWRLASEAAAEAESAMDALLERAQSRQLREERRSYIVGGVARVLGAQGFQVAEPDLLRAGDLESDVVIRASREGGRRRLDVQVPADGPITYEVDGYAMRTVAGAAGPSGSCDEAEDRIEALHRELASQLGIRMGELTWEGKDPKRIRKGALDAPAPGGAATSSSRGGTR